MDAKDQRAEIMGELAKAREMFEAIAETHGHFSKLYRVRFEALVEAGFTEQQAMEIVKARGLN